MKQVLEGIPIIGNLDVKMSDDSTCDNADAHIIFRTLPGNQDLFEVTCLVPWFRASDNGVFDHN